MADSRGYAAPEASRLTRSRTSVDVHCCVRCDVAEPGGGGARRRAPSHVSKLSSPHTRPQRHFASHWVLHAWYVYRWMNFTALFSIRACFRVSWARNGGKNGAVAWFRDTMPRFGVHQAFFSILWFYVQNSQVPVVCPCSLVRSQGSQRILPNSTQLPSGNTAMTWASAPNSADWMKCLRKRGTRPANRLPSGLVDNNRSREH